MQTTTATEPTKAPAKASGKKATATAKAKTIKSVPRYKMGPWPSNAHGKSTARSYCHAVAMSLQAKNGNGFTIEEYAEAIAANAGTVNGKEYKVPSGGWGKAGAPSGNATAYANWFANPKQGWLTQV